MSERNENRETVAGRVNAVIETTPPQEGRNSRLGHISIEDFAALIGTTKTRVIDWRKGVAFPDARNRERLAEASDGRYSADDFRRPDEQALRAELEEEVDDLKYSVLALLGVARELMAAVQELGGAVPDAAIEELARAAARMQSGGQPS